MGMIWTRKVSLFDVVDDSSALAKKAHRSLNGGNNMTPLINKWYEKPSYRDSMNFGEEEDSSGMASKRGVLKMINIQSLATSSPSPAVFTSICVVLRWIW